MRKFYEVKSGSYSLGITPWFKSADLWFRESGNAHRVELFELSETGVKKLIKVKAGNGFSIRDISKGKSTH